MQTLKAKLAKQTPLHTAVLSGDLRKVRSAVEKYDVHAQDNTGATPLHLAASTGSVNIVNELLARHASATATTAKSAGAMTPVHIAAAHGHVDIIDSMLGHRNCKDAALTKAELVNARDAAGCTPLLLAVVGRHRDLATHLVTCYGADASLADQSGYTPMLSAAHTGDVATLAALQRVGVSVDGPRLPTNGWSPLHAAAAAGQEGAAKWLVQNGANLATTDNFAETAATVAHKQGHLAIYKMLRDAANSAPASPSAAVHIAHGVAPTTPIAFGFPSAAPAAQGRLPAATGDSFLASATRMAGMPSTLYPVPPA